MYPKKCPSSWYEGQQAGKDVSYCETQEYKQYHQGAYEPNEQDQLQKPEHQLEICTELLPTHGHNLQLQDA